VDDTKDWDLSLLLDVVSEVKSDEEVAGTSEMRTPPPTEPSCLIV